MAYRFSYGFGRRGFGTISDDIRVAASRYNVPPSLALAVAQRESGLNQNARGTSGEIGVFQLMPGTARDLGVDPSDLSQNIDGGLRYLSRMYQKFGDWRTALEAYNAGPGRVLSGNIPSSSISYADGILGQTDVTAFDFGPGPSPIDSSDPTGGDGAGLSAGAMAGLGIAATALLAAFLVD